MSNQPELPANHLRLSLASRNWNGVHVELAEYWCAGRVLRPVGHGQEARLGAILDEIGRGRCEPRVAADQPCPVEYKPRQVHFAPAGMEIWAYTADSRFVKSVDLTFDAVALHERLGIRPRGRSADIPRLRFTDDRIWTLVKLLSEAVEDPDPSSQLYGDSLIAAIAVRLFEQPASSARAATKLSALQLKDAVDFMNAQLPARVDLATLASFADLSPSHYSRAFKASTGLAPYQWQLRARIERAKDLLFSTRHSLEEVAAATGFADAVHLGRTFRKMTGATPDAWRKERHR
jgi:AraC-like DNA-binding protein